MSTIRIGIVGLGANTRLRHVPGLRACGDVEILGVCNRSTASTQAAADTFSIPRTYRDWRELVADRDIDAVVIGTWPSLHCEITLAALAAGKHVLTEARMARDEREARRMLDASLRHPHLVAQIVPSPFGLQIHNRMKRLLAENYLGQLQEIVVLGVTDAFADRGAPRHWRQSKQDSGLNMLALGILHETLLRWVSPPIRVFAQGGTFTAMRYDIDRGEPAPVEIPDSVHVLTEHEGGARGIYHLSNVASFGPGMQIHLYGSEGTLKYSFQGEDQLVGARRGDKQLQSLVSPNQLEEGWRVEAEFINAIRGLEPVRFTDFATGVRYMDFTAAVARSLQCAQAISLV